MKNETRADKKFHRVLREYYRNELRSSSGEPIKNRERAIAIAFSEARRIDPRYHITKHANGAKIKIDNTLQIVFEDAWQHYLNYIASTRENTKPVSFEQWLRTTNEGLKYNKRMAQLIRYNEIIVQPQMNERGAKISNNDEHRGGKIRGHLHRNGGVRAVIVDTKRPVELELDELVITKGVARSEDDVVCIGKPEGIASRLNERYNGDKISNKNATCHLKTEIMERRKKINKMKKYENGTKIKSFLGIDDASKIEREIERQKELKQDEMENLHAIERDAKNTLIKINEHDDFKIVCELKSRNFESLKMFCAPTKNIYVYRATLPQLIEFLDMYGIHYTEFDDKQEFDEFIKNQLPSRIKNKLQ